MKKGIAIILACTFFVITTIGCAAKSNAKSTASSAEKQKLAKIQKEEAATIMEMDQDIEAIFSEQLMKI